jgi:hypothetical protein
MMIFLIFTAVSRSLACPHLGSFAFASLVTSRPRRRFHQPPELPLANHYHDLPLARQTPNSSSFVPPAAPAICNALGRPRTNTSDNGPGFVCTIAPAFFAAAIASLRGRLN